MNMPTSNRILVIAATAAAVLLTACATTPVEPDGAAALRARLIQLQSDPQLGSRAPLAMEQANTAVTLAEKPELAKLVLNLQKQGSEYAMSHPDEMVSMTVAKLGMKREAVELSVKNVELNWKMTPEMVDAGKAYAQHMLELKQIRALPDFATFFDTKISDQLSV